MNKHYGKQGIRFLQLQFEIGDTYNSKRNEWKKEIFHFTTTTKIPLPSCKRVASHNWRRGELTISSHHFLHNSGCKVKFEMIYLVEL